MIGIMMAKLVLATLKKMTVLERATYAEDFLLTRGQTDGERHKMWVIDQALRILLGNKKDYDEAIEWYICSSCKYYAPENDGDTCTAENCSGDYYEYYVGIAT